mgnify:CR=1 FL=1
MFKSKYILILVALYISISSCQDDEPLRADIRGKAILPSSCGEREFTYILVPNNAELENKYGSGLIDSTGSFTIRQVFIENYDIYLKPRGVLQKKFSDINVLECQNRIEFGPFTPGDLNEDNTVNVDDFRIFSSNYGTSMSDPEYNILSDFNCDGVIDKPDFAAFSAAYNETGDEP